MIRRIGYPLALLALFAIAGGHWAVLQSVAWAGMLVDYSKQSGLRQGIDATFDGAHPCPLCEKVEQAKKQEQHAPSALVQAKKADPFVCAVSESISRRVGVSFSWPQGRDFGGALRADRPPVPPPRSLPS